MDEAAVSSKKNWAFIIGVLIMCVGMQLANYGTAVTVSGEINAMGATQYYALVACMGSMGMMLILPIVGRLTGILGQRNMILFGIIIQLAGRIVMMLCSSWIPYTAAYFVQSLGGGFYVSSAYVNIATAVTPAERPKYFGYIAVANAIGAVFGPIIISGMYDSGGLLAKLSYIANLPLTLLGFLLLFRHCSTKKTPGAGKGFDYPGLVLTVVGLACLTLWLNLGGKMFAWLSVPSILMLAVALLALIVMFRRELTIANPAVPIRMFKNKRLTYAFIGCLIGAVFSTCSSTYCVMWIRVNCQGFPASTFFNGTATLAQQLMIFILGLFLGGFIAKKFVRRFRPFGISAMAAAVVACGLLYCLRFTGSAANGDLLLIGDGLPVGMIIVYLGTAIGGYTACVAQSTFSAFWQSNTPPEDIPSGQALYSFAGSGGSVLFGAVVGVVLGTSTDYSRAFATGLVFSVIGLICAVVGFKFSKEELAAAQ